MNRQIYCTLDELNKDLSLNGGNSKLMRAIESASRWISQRAGNFIPIKATRSYQFQGTGRNIVTNPILSILSILNNGVAVTDFTLHPQNRLWENGPYIRIENNESGWDDEDIQISALWGKWDQAEPIGVSVTQATETETSLILSNGSLLSVGMILLIEDEQEYVSGYGALSNLTSLLNGAIDAAQEEIIIDNGSEVNEGEVIQLSTERMLVRMVEGNTLVVVRGYEDTAKQAHIDDTQCKVQRTFTVERGVNGTTPVAHNNKPVYQQVAPEDVNFLCRQIAGLMYQKAKTNFAGRAGSIETGETFYYSEFPSTPIKEVIRNYRIVQL